MYRLRGSTVNGQVVGWGKAWVREMGTFFQVFVIALFCREKSVNV